MVLGTPPGSGGWWLWRAEAGDAKLSGVAVANTTVERDHHLFRLDLQQAVFTGTGDDRKHLLVQVWRPGREAERIMRY